MFGQDLAAMIATANQQVAALMGLQLPDLANLAPLATSAHDLKGRHINQAAALDWLTRLAQTK